MTSDNLPARRVPAGAAMDLTGTITSLQDALDLADALAKSRMVPRSMQGNPASIFHVIMTGQQLGLHWTQAPRVIYSPGDGQIGLRGSFLLAQLRKHGHSYAIDEGDDYCSFTVTRGDTGESYTATFTDDMAVTAGLMKRTDDGKLVARSREGNPLPWMLWTPRMRRWRAVADACGFLTPEVALGFEIEGIQAEEPQQPEVMLKPETPAPPESPAGEAAPGGDQAAQVAALDEQARTQSRAVADSPQAEEDQAFVDAVSEVSELERNNPANVAPEVIAERTVGRARQALERRLMERFTALGWSPEQYRKDMLRACSFWCRRPIVNVRGMQPGEMTRLADELEVIWNRNEPAARVVALADALVEWSRQWAAADPEAFRQYAEAK